MPDPVDAAADRLYGLTPDEFTAARNAAAKELRERGLREEAEHVRALPRPTAAAWAVNQLPRRHAADLDEFLAAAGDVRSAQLGGEGDLRAAIVRQRDALERLLGAACAELGGDVSESIAGRIRQTLEAAAVDDEAAEEVRRGRLARELEPRGFGTLAAHAPPRGRRRGKRAPRDGASGGEQRRKALQAARAQLREKEEEHRAALAEERQAHRRWQQAQAETEAAAARVDAARKVVDELRRS
jgi:hypothetical protein